MAFFAFDVITFELKRKNSRTNRTHDRYDSDYLSITNVIDDFRSSAVNVVSKKQVIMNKAIAMTNDWYGKKITNDKSLKQIHSVIRQVNTIHTNLEIGKQRKYLLLIAPKSFIHDINKVIESCNDYIERNPLVQLDGKINKMDNVDVTLSERVVLL